MAGQTHTPLKGRIEPHYTTGQVAKYMRVAPKTVSKWFATGLLKGYRIPNSNDRRISASSIREFLKEQGMPLGPFAAERKVLLVDLPGHLVEKLESVLTPADGWELRVEHGSFAAGITVADWAPALVVVDFGIGRSNAIALAKHAKSFRDGSVVERVIALVGEDDQSLDLMEVFNAVFQFPFDSSRLIECLRSPAEYARV